MRYFVFAIICSAMSLGQENAPSIRGHHIGESVSEFLSIAAASGKLVSCHDLLADPKLPKRMSKDATLKLQVDDCIEIANVIRTGTGQVGSGQIPLGVAGHSIFDHDKLVEIELDFWNFPSIRSQYSFETVLRDFASKFGSPSREWSDNFQNGFGAQFSYRRALWKTQSVIVSLRELQDDSATAIVQDRSREEQIERDAEASRKSVLDR